MPEGKYFYLRTTMNNMVLDIKGGGAAPGTKVITFPKKEEEQADNQLWFEDHVTRTIRSLKNPDACLDINDNNTLIISEFDEDRENQKWRRRGPFVVNRHDENRVLDVAQAQDGKGTRICAWPKHGRGNQKWHFDYLPAKYFYIKSKMNGKVLGVKKGDPSPGTKVATYDKRDEPSDDQLWYENRYGAVCSKLNDFAIDTSEDTVTLQPFEEDEKDRLWSVYKERIVNQLDREKVLDIRDKKDKDGAKLISEDWKEDENQCWEFDYLD